MSELSIRAEQIEGLEEFLRTIVREEITMATKGRLPQFTPKEKLNIAMQELRETFNALDIRIEKYGKRLASFQTVTFILFMVLFVMLSVVFGKVLFGS